MAPLDRVLWTEEVASDLRTLDASAKNTATAAGKEIWITGTVDETVLKQFVSRQWKVTENASDALLGKANQLK
jgi:hypothetical protein